MDALLPHTADESRYAAGLTEAEVRRLQTILREQCGVEIRLPEAWSRAIELLALVEMLLQSRCGLARKGEVSTGFAFPRT